MTEALRIVSKNLNLKIDLFRHPSEVNKCFGQVTNAYLKYGVEENPSRDVSDSVIDAFIRGVSKVTADGKEQVHHYKPVDGKVYDDDSTFSWCAAYVSDLIQNANLYTNLRGLLEVKSGVAKTLFDFLIPQKYAKYLDVILLQRGKSYHIALFAGMVGKNEYYSCIGGNQKNKLCLLWYPTHTYKSHGLRNIYDDKKWIKSKDTLNKVLRDGRRLIREAKRIRT